MHRALVLSFIVLACSLATPSYAADLYVATTGDDTANNCQDSVSPCVTVQHAIDQASADDTIHIEAGSYLENLTITSLNLTLQGNSSSDTVLDGNAAGRVITVTDSSVTVSDVTVTNGSVADHGGGILIDATSTLVVNDGLISANNATGAGNSGGGLLSNGGEVTLNRTRVINNQTAEGSGGGLASFGAVTLSGSDVPAGQHDCVIHNNRAPAATIGGAGTMGDLTVTNCTISENTAISVGGLFTQNGDLSIADSVIRENSSDTTVGGIHLQTGNMTIRRSLIANNTSVDATGGVSYSSADAGDRGYIENTTISGNSTDGGAAGLFLIVGNLFLNHVTIVNNVADADSVGGGGDGSGDGGGIVVVPGHNLTMINSIVANNVDPTSDPDCYGPITSLGHNIIGTISTNCALTPDSTDTVGEDPLLSDLADNGGSSETHALQEGSPAIAKSNCQDTDGATVTVDQRGSARPSVDCDSGAFQTAQCGDSLLDVNEECDDGNTDDGDGCSSICTNESSANPAGSSGGGCSLIPHP